MMRRAIDCLQIGAQMLNSIIKLIFSILKYKTSTSGKSGGKRILEKQGL